jgi:hypothetical protein
MGMCGPMARSINIQLGHDSEWLRDGLTKLAECVIDDNEAGQREAKVSPLVRMLASSFIGNSTATVWLLRELKRIATEGASYQNPALDDQAIMQANRIIAERLK